MASEEEGEGMAKGVLKRYEGLVMVRTKAIKGKGAWYWAHLEPILVNKAVKLRCSLCDAVFSASNPSRTASEHLKRGTCPNFNNNNNNNNNPSSSTSLVAVASSSNTTNTNNNRNHRKRSTISPTPLSMLDPSSSRFTAATAAAATYPPPIVTTVVPPLTSIATTTTTTTTAQYTTTTNNNNNHHHHQNQHLLLLSGGKEDLSALAMLEESVKRLKTSPNSSPLPPTFPLSKPQLDTALDSLADWLYDSCGSVSFSSLDHPKFRAFLNQVGLPTLSTRDFAASRLDAKYHQAMAQSDSKIRDAMFFQVASHGWNPAPAPQNFVHLAVNLPNGTSLFRRAVFTTGYVPSKYAEEILWDTITGITGNTTTTLHQCVGIVSDKFKGKALKNLENQHPWMVNLCCQYHGFNSLVKDFGNHLPLFKCVAANCLKLANFINSKSQVRHSFHKYQLQEYGHAGLLRVPFQCYYERWSDFGQVYMPLLEDILTSAQALQLVLLDDSFKLVLMEEPTAREIEEMTRNPRFWNELEAVHSIVKLIKGMAQEIETEKPRVAQCLPLWEQLKIKVKDWCSRFHITEGPIEKVIQRRFKKNYHPAWAAAFILDPLYLIRDTSGKYLPPFKCLTPEQEKDVDKLITRLVSREEAHIAVMELMKWRTEGLDPVYAQAVQLKQKDPNTGKMKIANPQSSRLVWETYLTEFKSLGKVAVRLIFLHATSCGFKCNWSLLRWVSAHSHSRVGIDRAQKLIFISAHLKMGKREALSDGDNDVELFALANGEDDVLNEVFVDTSSVSI